MRALLADERIWAAMMIVSAAVYLVHSDSVRAFVGEVARLWGGL